MAGIDVFFDDNGQGLTVWFDHPVKRHTDVKCGNDVILHKDERGNLVGVKHMSYFANHGVESSGATRSGSL